MKAEHAILRAVPAKKYPTGRGSLPLPYRYIDRLRPAASQDLHRDRLANGIAVERRDKIIGIAHRLTTDRDQDIANKQATFFRRSTLFQPQHKQPLFLFTLESLARRFRNFNRLCTDSEIPALDRAVRCK